MIPLKWILFLLILSIYTGFYFTLPIPLEEIHLINFSVLTLLYKKAFENSGRGQHIYWKALVLTVFIGSLDEFIQKFIPGRFADWHDIGLCLIGALLGALLAWIFDRRQ